MHMHTYSPARPHLRTRTLTRTHRDTHKHERAYDEEAHDVHSDKMLHAVVTSPVVKVCAVCSMNWRGCSSTCVTRSMSSASCSGTSSQKRYAVGCKTVKPKNLFEYRIVKIMTIIFSYSKPHAICRPLDMFHAMCRKLLDKKESLNCHELYTRRRAAGSTNPLPASEEFVALIR